MHSSGAVCQIKRPRREKSGLSTERTGERGPAAVLPIAAAKVSSDRRRAAPSTATIDGGQYPRGESGTIAAHDPYTCSPGAAGGKLLIIKLGPDPGTAAR